MADTYKIENITETVRLTKKNELIPVIEVHWTDEKGNIHTETFDKTEFTRQKAMEKIRARAEEFHQMYSE